MAETTPARPSLPTRAEVIDALSWHETPDRGRWGWDYASQVVAHLEEAARAPLHAHHEGSWSLNDSGECECECSRCYRDEKCVCPECSDRKHHDHTERKGSHPSSGSTGPRET